MKLDQGQLAQTARLLKESEKVWITTHVKSDGDGIGSEIALYRALRAMGKDARVVNDTCVPHSLRFLMRCEGEILLYDPLRDLPFLREADTAVVLDVGLAYRLGRLEQPFLESGARKVCLDHHLDHDPIFTHSLVDSTATSTGEVLYPLLKAMGVPITPDVAAPLFASISVDSGNFAYERCTPETFRTAADLVAAGANPYQVHLSLNWERPLEEIRLEGEVIQRLRIDPCGRVAHSEVTAEMLRRYRINPMEMPTVVNIPLSLKDVEVALLFVEMEPCCIKVSARSKGAVRVSDLAHRFGGGGHPLAAGFSVKTSLDEARTRVLAEARDLLGLPSRACADVKDIKAG